MPGEAAQDLRVAREKLWDAVQMKDRAAFEALVNDSFSLVDPEGRVISKKQLLDVLVTPSFELPRVTDVEADFQTVVEGVIVREIGEARAKGTLIERDISGYLVYSATYVKGQHDWQLAGASLTKQSIEVEIEDYYERCMVATNAKDRPALEELFHEDYYLVDDRGNILDREGMIDSVVHADTRFTNFVYHDRHRIQYQLEGDTIRDVTQMTLTGKYMDPTTQTMQGTSGNYIYTATYVRGESGDLRVISNTMTKIL